MCTDNLMKLTIETTMIKPAAELGSVLTSRSIAEELRLRLVEIAGRGERVVVDFDGVEAMSPSFADEIFAKLPAELVESGAVRFENLDEDLLTLMRFVLAGRASASDSSS
jgi:hypothetical protein